MKRRLFVATSLSSLGLGGCGLHLGNHLTETTWIQVGPMAFKTRDEAEKQVTVICKEKMN